MKKWQKWLELREVSDEAKVIDDMFDRVVNTVDNMFKKFRQGVKSGIKDLQQSGVTQSSRDQIIDSLQKIIRKLQSGKMPKASQTQGGAGTVGESVAKIEEILIEAEAVATKRSPSFMQGREPKGVNIRGQQIYGLDDVIDSMKASIMDELNKLYKTVMQTTLGRVGAGFEELGGELGKIRRGMGKGIAKAVGAGERAGRGVGEIGKGVGELGGKVEKGFKDLPGRVSRKMGGQFTRFSKDIESMLQNLTHGKFDSDAARANITNLANIVKYRDDIKLRTGEGTRTFITKNFDPTDPEHIAAILASAGNNRMFEIKVGKSDYQPFDITNDQQVANVVDRIQMYSAETAKPRTKKKK